jgi:hypothetical protein
MKRDRLKYSAAQVHRSLLGIVEVSIDLICQTGGIISKRSGLSPVRCHTIRLQHLVA